MHEPQNSVVSRGRTSFPYSSSKDYVAKAHTIILTFFSKRRSNLVSVACERRYFIQNRGDCPT